MPRLMRWLLAIGLALALVAAPFAVPARADEDADDDIDVGDEDYVDAGDDDIDVGVGADDEDIIYDQQEAQVHPLTDMEEASPDVVTTYWIPDQEDNSDMRIPVGKEVSIVTGFINTRSAEQDSSGMRVKAILGSLNSAYDFSYHVQNFSLLSFQPVEVVEPGSEVSFEYTFRISPEVDLQPMQIALSIFYEDDTESYTTQFFNETVMLYEPSNGFDLHTLGTYVFAFGFTALAMWGLWSLVQRTLKSKGIVSSRRRPVATASSAGNDDSWMDGLNIPTSKGTRKRKTGKSSKK